MEFLIIVLIALILIVVLAYIFCISKKKIIQIAENKELNEITKKYPTNIEICKKYLKKLKNENVKI